MFDEGFTRSGQYDIQTTAQLFTGLFSEEWLSSRSFFGFQKSKHFPTWFQLQNISLDTLILTDIDAKNFSLISIFLSVNNK